MPNNNEIFLDFWKTYQWPEEKKLSFRLYHDLNGKPIKYSREDEPGLYIDVTPEEFAIADTRVRIKNGQLIKPSAPRPPKLTPSNNGTACHPSDITILVDANNKFATHWEMKIYEQD
jgi:hypothetical protein